MKFCPRILLTSASFLLAASPFWPWPRKVRSVLASNSTQRTPEPVQAQSWFQKGQAALQSGDLDAAEAAFHRVLALDPQSGAAYANLGVVAMRRKNWAEALKYLQKAQRLSPQMTGIRLNIGLTEFRSGNYKGAIVPLESVLRDEPDSRQARYLLGLCQMFTDQFAEAVRTLEPLWAPMSTDVMYLYVLAISAHEAGEKELDQKALKQMLAVGGNSPELHLILGKAYYLHQEYDRALVELQKAHESSPDLPLLHFNLGMTYTQLGQYGEGEREFLSDVTIDPDLPDNYYQLGLLYARQQREADAERAFRETLKRDPHRSGAWFGLAKIYEGRQEYGEALEAVDESIKIVPDSRKVHFLRAQILQRLGRTEEAKTEFATAKKLMDKGLEEDREKMERLAVPIPGLTETPN